MATRVLLRWAAAGSALEAPWGLQAAAGRFAALLHTSRAARWPDVVIPPLGESVSEGTISAVLKAVGDKVAVDEAVAQLETDKVTIDVKSPHAGAISAIAVKVGQVVRPGAVVCAVGDGAAAGGVSSAAPRPPASSSDGSGVNAAGGNGSGAAVNKDRMPMIHFPPRMLPDGRRISDLPASEADAALATLSSTTAHATPGSVANPASAPPPTPPPPPPQKPAAASQTSYHRPLPIKPRTTLNSGPPRRTLTQREIDAINAGGVL